MVYSLLGLPGLYNPLNPGVGIPGQAMPPVGPLGQPQGGMPMPTGAPQMPMNPGMAMNQGAAHQMPPVPTPPTPPPGLMQQLMGAGGGLPSLMGGLGGGQQGLNQQQARMAGVDMSKIRNMPEFVGSMFPSGQKGQMTPDMAPNPQGGVMTGQAMAPPPPPQNWWELPASAFGNGTPWG